MFFLESEPELLMKTGLRKMPESESESDQNLTRLQALTGRSYSFSFLYTHSVN